MGAQSGLVLKRVETFTGYFHFGFQTGVESEPFFALDFFLLRARSDIVMLPIAGTRGLWWRRASKVAVTAP